MEEEEPNYIHIERSLALSSRDCYDAPNSLLDALKEHHDEIDSFFRDVNACNNSKRGYVLMTNITNKEYARFIEAMQEKRLIHSYLVQGDVLLYEPCTAVHAGLAKIFDHFLCYSYNERVNDGDVSYPIRAVGAKHLLLSSIRTYAEEIAQEVARAPDCGYIHASSANLIPPLLVEVAYAESIQQLHQVISDLYMAQEQVWRMTPCFLLIVVCKAMVCYYELGAYGIGGKIGL
jgi:hypothetical protein